MKKSIFRSDYDNGFLDDRTIGLVPKPKEDWKPVVVLAIGLIVVIAWFVIA